jgi:hypothetical protein
MAANAADVFRRFESAKAERERHEPHWRDCYLYTHPMRSDGLLGREYDAVTAARELADLLDSTATDSANTLAANFQSGMTPANSRWFALDSGEESDEERQWFDMAADVCWQNIHNSNFDAEAFEGCLDLIDAGWFVLYVDEDRERGGLTFEQWPIGQCYLASTRSDGATDVVFRRYKIPAIAVVQEFGDAASENVRKLAQQKPNDLVELLRVIEPRKVYATNARMAKNLPIASCTYEVKTKTLLRESGYHEMPCIVPRWQKLPGSSYAIGPVSDVLGNARMLNKLMATTLDAADVAVSGMWLAVDDGVLNPKSIKIGPKKVVIAAEKDSLTPLQTGANFNLSFELVDRLQGAIRKGLMADQLQPQDKPDMTAYEVSVRVAMIRQLLGPRYGRLQSEYLRPLVERVFGLAFRAGALGAPPQSLVNRDFTVRYISPLARAQKQEDVNAMDRHEMSLYQHAQMDPSALDGYRWDKARAKRAELLGVPADLILTADELAEVRAQKQEAQQEQQAGMVQQQAAMSAADSVGKRMMGG